MPPDETTVLFADDSEGYTSLLDHAAAAGAPKVVAWDDHTPRVKNGRALLKLLNEADADPEHELPDVVLIDDWMSWDGTEQARPNAVRLVGMVTRLLQARRPKRVLWTSKQEEPPCARSCVDRWGVPAQLLRGHDRGERANAKVSHAGT